MGREVGLERPHVEGSLKRDLQSVGKEEEGEDEGDGLDCISIFPRGWAAASLPASTKVNPSLRSGPWDDGHSTGWGALLRYPRYLPNPTWPSRPPSPLSQRLTSVRPPAALSYSWPRTAALPHRRQVGLFPDSVSHCVPGQGSERDCPL